MGLILENNNFSRQDSIRRCVLRQEVVKAVSMERSVCSKSANPLLLDNRAIKQSKLFRSDVVLFKMNNIFNLRTSVLSSILPNRGTFDRGLLVH
jgi:hypothetical protein